MHAIGCKRVYENPAGGDGKRILVDRLWPRGISKEVAQIDRWEKDIAPSTDLRKWFSHDPPRYEAFSSQYILELDANPHADDFLDALRQTLETEDVTFVYAAKDVAHNHALILQSWAEKRLRQE